MIFLNLRVISLRFLIPLVLGLYIYIVLSTVLGKKEVEYAESAHTIQHTIRFS